MVAEDCSAVLIQPVAAQTGLLNGEMRRPRPGGARKKVLSPEARLCAAIILAAFAFSAVSWTAGWKPVKLEAGGELGRFQSFAAKWWGWQPKQEPGWPETLVVYIFSNTDPEYFNNLKFFLKWGVREGDGAYYIIVVQEGGKSPVRPHTAVGLQNEGGTSGWYSIRGVLACLLRLRDGGRAYMCMARSSSGLLQLGSATTLQPDSSCSPWHLSWLEGCSGSGQDHSCRSYAERAVLML